MFPIKILISKLLAHFIQILRFLLKTYLYLEKKKVFTIFLILILIFYLFKLRFQEFDYSVYKNEIFYLGPRYKFTMKYLLIYPTICIMDARIYQ